MAQNKWLSKPIYANTEQNYKGSYSTTREQEHFFTF
jgi:hypothetical protein